MRFEYLLLMAACVALTLPLEFVLRARVYARWRRAVVAILPVALVFALWDIVVILRDHWHFSPAHTTGWTLGPLPVEEMTFFVVIPLCALLTHEAVGTVLSWWRSRRNGSIHA